MSLKRNHLPTRNATPTTSWARRDTGRALLFAAVCALLLIGGCADNSSQSVVEQGQIIGDAESDCPVVIDIGDWTSFRDLANRAMSPDGKVTIAEWSALLDRPGFEAWRDSYRNDDSSGKTPMPRKLMGDAPISGIRRPENPLGKAVAEADLPDDKEFVILALGHIFDRTAGSEGRGTGSGIGNALRIEYHYALRNAEKLTDNVTRLGSEEVRCELWQLMRRWIDDENLPPVVKLRLVPMDRQFVQQDDDIIVGTSVVAAGAPGQLIRQIAGLYYRERQAVPGPDPQLAAGEEVVAQICRLLLNEGVMGHFQKVMHVGYDAQHPRIGEFNPVPEMFFERGAWLVNIFNRNLPKLLADPEEMNRLAEDLVKMIRRSNGINMGSYCMAETIVANLGPDRLHACRQSVSEFLRTYQEAAAMNKLPLARPGEIGRPYHECMPTFDEDMLDELLVLVQRYFPES